MITNHNLYIDASQHMNQIKDLSIDLVVTSPPYPMIEMWDDIMSKQNPKISDYLEKEPEKAFELMHQELDKVWKECFRVIKPGGFCVLTSVMQQELLMGTLLFTITIVVFLKHV